MATLATTEGITISAITCYQVELSSPKNDKYCFSYKIKIENGNTCKVQLLRRHWVIYNANGYVYEVEGEGVIGLQPILEPGQSFEYISGCVLETPIGKMEGSYKMHCASTNQYFDVVIPELNFVVPHILN
jgi:ApaG protein